MSVKINKRNYLSFKPLIKFSLRKLSEYITSFEDAKNKADNNYKQKKIMALIDEYDTPIYSTIKEKPKPENEKKGENKNKGKK